MATHSSILAWRLPWSEEPGGLQSMELQRVSLSLFLSLSHTHTHTTPEPTAAFGDLYLCSVYYSSLSCSDELLIFLLNPFSNLTEEA